MNPFRYLFGGATLGLILAIGILGGWSFITWQQIFITHPIISGYILRTSLFVGVVLGIYAGISGD